MRIFLSICLFACSYFSLHSQIPEWFQTEMEKHVGTWEMDNAAYVSEQEPFSQYVMDWSWGIGKSSLVGALYGIQDGERVGPFWEFRQYWDPKEKQGMLMQFGAGGVVGNGSFEQVGSDSLHLQQIFHSPEGPSFRTGHRIKALDGKELQASYEITEGGEWILQRKYIVIKSVKK